MTMKHTQLPYRVAIKGDEVFYHAEVTICSNDGTRSIADMVGDMGIDKDNADFIVKACNNHYALCYAIESFLQCFGDKPEKCISIAKEALAQAKGGL